MTTCKKCESELTVRILPEFRADAFVGLPNVLVLDAAKELRCSNSECGELVGVSIPDSEGLQVAVAVQRVMIPVRMGGAEIRFLRNTLGIKARELARLLEVTPETVSRWENERKPMAPELEKLLRVSVGVILSEHAPAVAFDPERVIKMPLAETKAGKGIAFFCRRTPVLMRQREYKLEEQTRWRAERTELPEAA